MHSFPRRHVFRDLCPYVCTFENCQSANKLFSSRNEWKHHEFQVHRRQYVCQRCQRRCPNRIEMSLHLREHGVHSDQIASILDLCEREVDPSDQSAEPCIFCREELSLSAWHDHVAVHLESHSLFFYDIPAERDQEHIPGSFDKVLVLK